MITLQNEANSAAESVAIDAPWFAVRTKSNCEKLAAMALEYKGYQQYLPLYRGRRRWSDRVVKSESPLFPGYVFCRVDRANPVRAIGTPGVVAIVGFGREPVPIPDAEIGAIKRMLASGIAAEPFPFLHEGERVRITRGSLDGLEGILLKKKSAHRFVISIGLLQRSVAVEIDPQWVSPI